jgi:hypothetical protein
MKHSNKDKLEAVEINLGVMTRKYESYEAKLAANTAQRQHIISEQCEYKDLVKELTEEQEKLTKAVAKNEHNKERYQIRKLCKKYDVGYEVDYENCDYDYAKGVPTRESKWWVSQPHWLEGDDPLVDGHFAHDYYELLWLVEFYAKHHPDHPDHANREYGTHNSC